MPTRYTALPSQEETNSRELADAFGSDEDEDETTPLQNHHPEHHDIEASAGLSTEPNSYSGDNLPGTYDFERDYDVPPPGSPPGPSSSALPNNSFSAAIRLTYLPSCSFSAAEITTFKSIITSGRSAIDFVTRMDATARLDCVADFQTN